MDFIEIVEYFIDKRRIKTHGLCDDDNHKIAQNDEYIEKEKGEDAMLLTEKEFERIGSDVDQKLNPINTKIERIAAFVGVDFNDSTRIQETLFSKIDKIPQKIISRLNIGIVLGIATLVIAAVSMTYTITNRFDTKIEAITAAQIEQNKKIDAVMDEIKKLPKNSKSNNAKP